MKRTLHMGMVGGGSGAFIGPVHRMAARLDDSFAFVAGALASSPDKAIESGKALGLTDDRNYPTWQAMLAAERMHVGEARLDLVSIVTPNATHHDIACAFIDAGFNVLIDKPMTTSAAHAAELSTLAAQRKVICCVSYNYTGYPLIKQARALIAAGELGEIRKVHATYCQGWLAHPIERDGQKQAAWRSDPQTSGGGAIGDIGSHAENLVRYVTGLEITSLSAQLNTLVAGRSVDDDANVLLKFNNGAIGLLVASQICIGSENDLQLSVYGTKGSLHWRQEQPNALRVMLDGKPEMIHRPANAHLAPNAVSASRLPPGHPEGFIEAFANVYRNVASAIRAGSTDGKAHDFPGAEAGVRGVKFIATAIESSKRGSAWLDLS